VHRARNREVTRRKEVETETMNGKEGEGRGRRKKGEEGGREERREEAGESSE
jgi:hypothetical protein